MKLNIEKVLYNSYVLILVGFNFLTFSFNDVSLLEVVSATSI